MKKYLGQDVAEYLGELVGLAQEDKEVVAYGLEQVLSNTIALFITFIIAYLLNILAECIIITICIILLRRLIGGAHCSTIWRCAITTCTIIVGIALITNKISLFIDSINWIVVASIWSLVATWIWAPSDNKKKPIVDLKLRKKLRNKAILIQLILIILIMYGALSESNVYQMMANASAGALAVMAIMITPLGHNINHRFDNLLGEFIMNFRKGGEKL